LATPEDENGIERSAYEAMLKWALKPVRR